MRARLAVLAFAASLAACSSLAPDKPVRATLYDFGVVSLAPAPAGARQSAIVLADLEAAGSLEGSSLLYRLGYANGHQLLPYAQARWAAPPPRLVRQRLREVLGRERAVLDASESAALARSGGAMPPTLRVDLEEFSHVFDSPTQSWGVVRLRVTLMENTSAGERLLGQRVFVQRQAAPSADAPGGVRALTAATDAAAQEIALWLAQPR
ncbi:ABC-type transport auxiliary lipoprotein family protein [Ramlibacter sp. PS4R-6]|uniref:ABC-type transport auxiliary lipoprotein family protein n=1 Tax=Ramlibacter sp. PS4R-6 TaxID=3133438 RepID=UPI0030B12503